LTEIFDEIAGGEDHIVSSSIEAELSSFSDAGRRRITEHYQWDQVADEYARLLTDLAGERASV
jgi:glycosyltransferase involved in cell wall biosynthesis